jgi:hypothetical protein
MNQISLDPAARNLAALLVFASVVIADPFVAGAAPQFPAAERATDLFLPEEPVRGIVRRSDSSILRSRPVWIAHDVLSQPESLPGSDLILELFEDSTVSLRVEQLKRRSPDAYTLVATVLGTDPGFSHAGSRRRRRACKHPRLWNAAPLGLTTFDESPRSLLQVL